MNTITKIYSLILKLNVIKTLKIRIWNITSGISLRTLTGHSDWVYVLTVLPFNRLASGSGTDDVGEIKIWNMNSGTLISTLLGHDGRVRAFAFLGTYNNRDNLFLVHGINPLKN